MAARGEDTLRFGPMKPVGLTDPNSGKRPYAVIQLRKENQNESMWNIVGFQTKMKINEQKRVFKLIPAFKNIEFLGFRIDAVRGNKIIAGANVGVVEFSVAATNQQ